MVLCRCGDIECCEMERYVSDVRIAYSHIIQLVALVVAFTRQSEWIVRRWSR
jgi:hypothetical protein